MKFNIALFEGTDILKFGMTSEEVKEVLGKEPRLFRRNEFDKHLTEQYIDICHVCYDESGCVAFEFYAPSQVFYNHTQLIEQERGNVEGLFCELDGYENKSDSFSVYNMDLAFYAPFGTIESVYVSRKGYTAEQHEFYMKKYDEKYKVSKSDNEALEKGVAVSELVLNSDNIDRNKPNTVLVVDKEENLGEITIKSTEKAAWSNELPISLKYCSTLEWVYTEERAAKLITYIRKHLEMSSVIEIFHIWLGNREDETTRKKLHIHISELLPTDFEKMCTAFGIDEYCIKITRE